MRGEDRAGDRAALTLDGITPACAGKTALEQKAEYVDWDHPRMRGEDQATYYAVCYLTGSPPHARGRRGVLIESLAVAGITPACAGKTE